MVDYYGQIPHFLLLSYCNYLHLLINYAYFIHNVFNSIAADTSSKYVVFNVFLFLRQIIKKTKRE